MSAAAPAKAAGAPAKPAAPADAPKAAADAAAVDAAPAALASLFARKKKLLLVAAAACSLVLAIGGGAAWWWLHGGNGDNAEAADGSDAAATAAADDAADKADRAAEMAADKAAEKAERRPPRNGPPAFVPLDAFTVNLADRETERYAQVGITLELDDPKDAETVKQYMPAIRNNILMVLAHKTSAELLAREGKLKLADEVRRESLRALGSDSQASVRAVQFSNFIIQ